jgi:hypothetical protein
MLESSEKTTFNYTSVIKSNEGAYEFQDEQGNYLKLDNDGKITFMRNNESIDVTNIDIVNASNGLPFESPLVQVKKRKTDENEEILTQEAKQKKAHEEDHNVMAGTIIIPTQLYDTGETIIKIKKFLNNLSPEYEINCKEGSIGQNVFFKQAILPIFVQVDGNSTTFKASLVIVGTNSKLIASMDFFYKWRFFKISKDVTLPIFVENDILYLLVRKVNYTEMSTLKAIYRSTQTRNNKKRYNQDFVLGYPNATLGESDFRGKTSYSLIILGYLDKRKFEEGQEITNEDLTKWTRKIFQVRDPWDKNPIQISKMFILNISADYSIIDNVKTDVKNKLCTLTMILSLIIFTTFLYQQKLTKIILVNWGKTYTNKKNKKFKRLSAEDRALKLKFARNHLWCKLKQPHVGNNYRKYSKKWIKVKSNTTYNLFSYIKNFRRIQLYAFTNISNKETHITNGNIEFKCIHQNIQGLNNLPRQKQIGHFLEHKKPRFLSLSETHLKTRTSAKHIIKTLQRS